jgi:hypothetical protein
MVAVTNQWTGTVRLAVSQWYDPVTVGLGIRCSSKLVA